VCSSDLTVTESKVVEKSKLAEDPHTVGWMFPKHASIQNYQAEDFNKELVEENLEIPPIIEQQDDYVFDTTEHAKTYIPEDDESIVDEIGIEEWNRLLEKAEQEVERERQEQRLLSDVTESDDNYKEANQVKEKNSLEHWNKILEEAEHSLREADKALKTERSIFLETASLEQETKNVSEEHTGQLEESDTKKKIPYIVKEQNQQIKKTREQ
jgi:hypothetical protein